MLESADGARWRPVERRPDDEEDDDEDVPVIAEDLRIELVEGTLRAVRANGSADVIATACPHDITPVAAAAAGGHASAVVFGNGTVLRMP